MQVPALTKEQEIGILDDIYVYSSHVRKRVFHTNFSITAPEFCISMEILAEGFAGLFLVEIHHNHRVSRA